MGELHIVNEVYISLMLQMYEGVSDLTTYICRKVLSRELFVFESTKSLYHAQKSHAGG